MGSVKEGEEERKEEERREEEKGKGLKKRKVSTAIELGDDDDDSDDDEEGEDEDDEEEEEEDEEEVKRPITKTFEEKLEKRRGGRLDSRHGKSLKTLELPDKEERRQREETGGVKMSVS